MSLIFDPETHIYTLDGVNLPSVTEITRFMAYDYKSDRPWLAEAVARRGTAIHEACMMIDYGEEPEETAEIAGYLQAYRRFLQDYNPEWELIEHPMAAKDIGVAGTLDRYGIIRKKAVILDIKTGSVIHHEAVAAQLTAYRWLLWRDRGVTECDCMALRLDKSGIYELFLEPDGGKYFDACKLLHFAQKMKGERVI